jgi:hypothetical protein
VRVVRQKLARERSLTRSIAPRNHLNM